MKIKKGILRLDTAQLPPSVTHKIRGYVGNMFKDYDIIHNHNEKDGGTFYRYPLIQFKILQNTAHIIAVTEKAIEAFKTVFFGLKEIVIDEVSIPVHSKSIELIEDEIGENNQPVDYVFQTPWIALNQKNIVVFNSSVSHQKKMELLEKTLVSNILSMCHKTNGLNYTVKSRLSSIVNLKPLPVTLKGAPMLGFIGSFSVNFIIPDLLGIGKSVSRGFGSVKKSERGNL